jgi:hypothetical protein
MVRDERERERELVRDLVQRERERELVRDLVQRERDIERDLAKRERE